jgi:hypothetical protein
MLGLILHGNVEKAVWVLGAVFLTLAARHGEMSDQAVI